MFKYKSLLAALSLAALITVGCNENTTDPTDTAPNAPTALMATSLGASEIGLKWTVPTGTYTGYKLRMTATGVDTTFVISVAATNAFKVSGLTEGTKYTFALNSVNGTAVSGTAPSITWSPATRLTKLEDGNDIRVYEYSSLKGSGLRLYNPVTKFPEVYTVASGSLWDIAFNNDGIPDSIDVGSPRLTFTTVLNPRLTLIGKVYSNISSLDDIYETSDLTVSGEQRLTFPNLSTTSYGFVVKTVDGNFAKVLLKSAGGSILRGTSDRYVVVEISYQSVANVPHAETNNSGGR